METQLKKSQQKYKRTLMEESIKEFTYKLFAHRPDLDFKEIEIRGTKVLIIRDVVGRNVYFTARFIFGGVEVEVKF